jgi:putative FmdB family regulatory protein
MPIYEFICQNCQQPFEELVRSDQVVSCPVCRSTEVRRLLSRFAVHSTSPNLGGGGAKSCSMCSGSHCATCN